MRPGLGHSGAFPLLALLGFLLLTLIPSLSGLSNVKLVDWTYFTGGASHLPLIQDGVAAFPPDTTSAQSPRSWILSNRSRSRANAKNLSAHASRAPEAPGEPGDSSPDGNDSRRLDSGHKSASPLPLMRRARALRTYLLKQLDDYQLFTSCVHHNHSTISTLTSPSLMSMNATPPPTLINDDSRSLPTAEEDNHIRDKPTKPDEEKKEKEEKTATESRLSSWCSKWQQACQKAQDMWPSSPTYHASTPQLSASLNPELAVHQPPSKIQKQLDGGVFSPGEASPVNSGLEPSLKTHEFSSTTNNQTTDAAGSTAELRGSCMAVVIGLVAGIMWF
ncbi:hypothetical protein N7539_004104 [Penicillium diatomitis]|uniref:Uncharacterized protein n=1 Tax=Penicillium diatomitis TaxID=2819901 RepID=A0A9W9XDD5_9EURO|nr:uncharacterized protein N7539_004104 [Penicillium diatomitis]KAJ5489214.1 hypothetical protein N7539_004104 [Penicillium diatomitis]